MPPWDGCETAAGVGVRKGEDARAALDEGEVVSVGVGSAESSGGGHVQHDFLIFNVLDVLLPPTIQLSMPLPAVSELLVVVRVKSLRTNFPLVPEAPRT